MNDTAAKKNEMITWVRERVATRWVQTRKRGGEGSATTTAAQSAEDDEDEDEETSSRASTGASSSPAYRSNHETANFNHRNRSNDDRETFISVDEDVDDQDNTAPSPYANRAPYSCPPIRRRPRNAPQEVHATKSPTPSNRSIHGEKHNSKLVM